MFRRWIGWVDMVYQIVLSYFALQQEDDIWEYVESGRLREDMRRMGEREEEIDRVESCWLKQEQR